MFKSFTSIYGLELWYDLFANVNNLRKMSVAYHKSVKKIGGFNVFDSNHAACSFVGVPVFRHHQALASLRFFLNICKSSSPCVSSLRHYFMYHSLMKIRVQSLFSSYYGVSDLFGNCFQALKSRIAFIERNEPISIAEITVTQ